jgi:hypothetical protein
MKERNKSSWSYARRHARSPLLYWALPRIIIPGGFILIALEYLGLFRDGLLSCPSQRRHALEIGR